MKKEKIEKNQKKKKKKGFTLIELLAVILILGVIALIAIPTVTNIIEDAKKKAAETSAKMYIDAVEQYMMVNEITSNYIKLVPDQTYQVSSDIINNYGFMDLIADKVYAEGTVYLNNLVDIKGTKPKYGEVTIGTDNIVATAKLIINDYKIEYTNNDGITSVVKGKVKLENTKMKEVEATLNGTSYAIDEEGNLYGWGNNQYGQLGDGTTIDKLEPVLIMPGTKFSSISAAGDFALAIDEAGNL